MRPMLCERLAAMRVRMLTLLAVAALLAGCGGSGTKSNGEAAKTPAQVLKDATAAAHEASAVHVSGSIVSGGTPVTLGEVTDIDGLMGQVTSSASHGKLANDGETTYKGQEVVVIRDTSDGSKLYVAATGPPYPVAIVAGKTADTGTVTFDGWNESVEISAPQGALDISKLGG
jgi:hypothetical protein